MERTGWARERGYGGGKRGPVPWGWAVSTPTPAGPRRAGDKAAAGAAPLLQPVRTAPPNKYRSRRAEGEEGPSTNRPIGASRANSAAAAAGFSTPPPSAAAAIPHLLSGPPPPAAAVPSSPPPPISPPVPGTSLRSCPSGPGPAVPGTGPPAARPPPSQRVPRWRPPLARVGPCSGTGPGAVLRGRAAARPARVSRSGHLTSSPRCAASPRHVVRLSRGSSPRVASHRRWVTLPRLVPSKCRVSESHRPFAGPRLRVASSLLYIAAPRPVISSLGHVPMPCRLLGKSRHPPSSDAGMSSSHAYCLMSAPCPHAPQTRTRPGPRSGRGRGLAHAEPYHRGWRTRLGRTAAAGRSRLLTSRWGLPACATPCGRPAPGAPSSAAS